MVSASKPGCAPAAHWWRSPTNTPNCRYPFPSTLGLVERALSDGGEPNLLREHVFNLLALSLDRDPVRIAARAFSSKDAYVRGTALEYLETVLPAEIFIAFQPLLAATSPAPVQRRPAAAVRADLIRAGETMTVSLDELRRQLDATAPEEV